MLDLPSVKAVPTLGGRGTLRSPECHPPLQCPPKAASSQLFQGMGSWSLTWIVKSRRIVGHGLGNGATSSREKEDARL